MYTVQNFIRFLSLITCVLILTGCETTQQLGQQTKQTFQTIDWTFWSGEDDSDTANEETMDITAIQSEEDVAGGDSPETNKHDKKGLSKEDLEKMHIVAGENIEDDIKGQTKLSAKAKAKNQRSRKEFYSKVQEKALAAGTISLDDDLKPVRREVYKPQRKPQRLAKGDALKAAQLAEEKKRQEDLKALQLAEEQRLEDERKAAELAEEQRLEEERKAAELAEEQRLEDERKAAELAEKQRLEEERKAAELAEEQRLEDERKAAELAEEQRLEDERKAAELAEEQRLEEERKAAELAEEQRLEDERKAAELAEKQRFKEEEARKEMVQKVEERPDTCPNVAVLEELNSLYKFSDFKNPVPENSVAAIWITSLDIECTVEDDQTELKMDLVFQSQIGPQAAKKRTAKDMSFPYFIALTDLKGNIVAKDLHKVQMAFKKGKDFLTQKETITQKLTKADFEDHGGFEALIGFQLDEEQLNYNRQAKINSGTFE